MRKNDPHTILTIILAVACLIAAETTIHAAMISDGYPGYPNQWEGLTTNTTIEITLDTPVALIGNPPAPDMDYCVKKATFSGLDIVLTDVSCEVEVSADQKTIKLFPTDLLEGNGLYAYKINNINFDGGGSQQDVAAYFETGDNPIPALALQLDEADLCDHSGETLGYEQANVWCARCHEAWAAEYPTVWGTCPLTP